MDDSVLKGMLYLVATPIGNLSDMSFRAVETLKNVDFILAEDTRHSIKLLNHFEISKKLVSYHEHNQYTKADSILQDLLNGKKIGLITDAGTPGISDPGSHLVMLCQENNIPYTIIPGPVALINALILSGQNTNRFVFEGFLPMKKAERQIRFDLLKEETRTMIFYEAPHKLKATIKDLKAVFEGERSISLVREITKMYEEVLKMTLDEAVRYYDLHDPKGEYVVVLEGMNIDLLLDQKAEAYAAITVEERLEELLLEGVSKKEAIKTIAKERQINKRELYLYFTKEQEESNIEQVES